MYEAAQHIRARWARGHAVANRRKRQWSPALGAASVVPMGRARSSRAVVQTGPQRFEIHEFARPAVGADDAILRIELCGICGSDIEQYDGRFADQGWVRGPTIPGHEPLGIIDEIGERAAQRWGVGVGDRLAVEPLIPCERCEAAGPVSRHAAPAGGGCRATGCWEPRSSPRCWAVTRSTCTCIPTPSCTVCRVPRDLAPEVAVLFNPLAAIVADEEDVVARVEELTGGRLADVVVDVSPVATQPILDAIEIVRYAGTIVLAGVKGGPTAAIDNDRIVFKSITIRGIFTVSLAAYRQAITLLTKGGLPSGRIHTAAYGLERAEEAILHLAGRLDGPPAINVAIAPGAPAAER
jgi:threonine dehydrogenase-like Zn-dependent dehydrogenase